MTGGTVGQARQWDIDLISLTDNSVPAINEQAFNVLKDGVLVGQSSTLNFKGAPVTVTNDPINKKMDVEFTGVVGASAMFPNGFEVVTESRMLTSDDIGKLLIISPAEGETSISLGTPSTAPFLPIGQIGVFNTSTEIDVTVSSDGEAVLLAPREIAILSSFNDTEDATLLLSGFTYHDGYRKTFNRYLVDIGKNVPFTGAATLVAGTVTVADARIRTGAKIIVSVDTPVGTQGFLSASDASIIDETSFVINSSSNTEASTVNYLFVNP